MFIDDVGSLFLSGFLFLHDSLSRYRFLKGFGSLSFFGFSPMILIHLTEVGFLSIPVHLGRQGFCALLIHSFPLGFLRAGWLTLRNWVSQLL